MNTMIMMRRLQLPLVACGTAVSLAAGVGLSAEPAAAQSAPRRLAALAARFGGGLDAIVQKFELPGMTAAYALPGGRVETFASGLADKESGAKMTPETRMLAGSVGKTFAAATALGLIQDGKLGLDDKIEKWLGQESWFDQLPAASDITVRHLMMHRSGVADHVYDPRFAVKVRKMIAALDETPMRISNRPNWSSSS